jgi:hypothetical protein
MTEKKAEEVNGPAVRKLMKYNLPNGWKLVKTRSKIELRTQYGTVRHDEWRFSFNREVSRWLPRAAREIAAGFDDCLFRLFEKEKQEAEERRKAENEAKACAARCEALQNELGGPSAVLSIGQGLLLHFVPNEEGTGWVVAVWGSTLGQRLSTEQLRGLNGLVPTLVIEQPTDLERLQAEEKSA